MSLSMYVTDIACQLGAHGFAWLRDPCDDAAFVALARLLGEIVDDTPVRVVAGKRTYLASPGPIPLHTDHPKADLVAWRCEAQDEHDGASLLVDAFAVLAALTPKERQRLASVRLPAAVRAVDAPEPSAIVSQRGGRTHVFFAPWLEPVDRSEEALSALVALRTAIVDRQDAVQSERVNKSEPGTKRKFMSRWRTS